MLRSHPLRARFERADGFNKIAIHTKLGAGNSRSDGSFVNGKGGFSKRGTKWLTENYVFFDTKRETL
jgi:hypothetical protein